MVEKGKKDRRRKVKFVCFGGRPEGAGGWRNQQEWARFWKYPTFPTLVLREWLYPFMAKFGSGNWTWSYKREPYVQGFIFLMEMFKGITRRICWLLFENTIFKVDPSSRVQSVCTSGGPTCLQSGNWWLCFYRVTLCYWLGATHHCQKVDTQKHPEHSKIRKSRQKAESLQIQTLPHTSSGS